MIGYDYTDQYVTECGQVFASRMAGVQHEKHCPECNREDDDEELDDDERPHGTNPAIFNGPCDCDACQAWDVQQRKPPMTMKDLSAAVLALVPKAHRVDISLTLRTQDQTWLIEPTEEPLVEVLAEISVWCSGEYYGVDAPTYELALDRFTTEKLPQIFPVPPVEPAPAMERLAEMEPKTP